MYPKGITMKFSVVMPIHNEEKFLPYSLPSIFCLKPDEVILIFDRCTDRSIEVAKKISTHFRYTQQTQFIKLNDPSPTWTFRVAFLRRYGFKIAKNDVILNTDADTILDSRIAEYLHLIGKNEVALVSFSRRHYPLTFQDFIARIIFAFSRRGFTGIYAFSRKAWLETENQRSVKETISSEDTHLRLSISKRYKTIFIRTDTIHLRPKETADRHFIRGFTYWSVKHNALWKAIFHSIIYLRPLLLAGYLHARLRNYNEC